MLLPRYLSGETFSARRRRARQDASFALPILQRILESGTLSPRTRGPRCGAAAFGTRAVPTRELALQVRDHIAAAARFTPIKCVAIVEACAQAGAPASPAPAYCQGTPGRLGADATGNEHLTSLHKLLCVVIDEADRMLSGHFEELENILRALPVVDPNSKRRKQ